MIVYSRFHKTDNESLPKQTQELSSGQRVEKNVSRSRCEQTAGWVVA